MSDKFGFTPRHDLSKVKPGGMALETPEPAVDKIDRAGDTAGFKSRESLHVISRRKNVGPTTALNVRCPVRVFNPFAKFCEAQGLTYWEAIERLMHLAGVGEDGQIRR